MNQKSKDVILDFVERMLDSIEDREIECKVLKFLDIVMVDEWIRESDYINTDRAMKILGLGKNRSEFFRLMREYGIENKKVNNMHIGFSKRAIIDLKERLRE